jgi:hypothetical protein
MIASLIIVACFSWLSLIYVIRVYVVVLLKYISSSHLEHVLSNRSISI